MKKKLYLLILLFLPMVNAAFSQDIDKMKFVNILDIFEEKAKPILQEMAIEQVHVNERSSKDGKELITAKTALLNSKLALIGALLGEKRAVNPERFDSVDKVILEIRWKYEYEFPSFNYRFYEEIEEQIAAM